MFFFPGWLIDYWFELTATVLVLFAVLLLLLEVFGVIYCYLICCPTETWEALLVLSDITSFFFPAVLDLIGFYYRTADRSSISLWLNWLAAVADEIATDELLLYCLVFFSLIFFWAYLANYLALIRHVSMFRGLFIGPAPGLMICCLLEINSYFYCKRLPALAMAVVWFLLLAIRSYVVSCLDEPRRAVILWDMLTIDFYPLLFLLPVIL